jgi:hypothetical protein
LLDLRGPGAMRAGSVPALAKIANRSPSQASSRYFYENPPDYGLIDGHIYLNAHNDEAVIALYERTVETLTCSPDQICRLDDEALRPLVLDVALRNNLVLT